MRVPLTTGTAIAVLAFALQGCATTEPAGIAPSLTSAEASGLTPDTDPYAFAGPSDLDGAILQARTQRLTGDYNGAVHTLGQLVLIAPDDARVLGEYGKTLVAKGESQDAVAFLSRAVELQPGDWSLHSAQGVAFDQIADYPNARRAYERALALRPGEPSVLSNAGLSRMQAGDLAGAQVLLSQAMQQGGDARVASNLALVERLLANRPAPALPAPAPEAAPADRALTQEPASDIIEQAEIAPPTPSNAQAGEAYQALAADPTVMMAPIPPETPPAPRPMAPVVEDAPQVAANTGDVGGLRRLSPTD
jgi:Flp pilus assembly protein TadD